MGFTLRLLDYPIRTVHWFGSIHGGSTISGWLRESATWVCDSSVEGDTDLYIRLVDGNYDIVNGFEFSNLGPLYNGKEYGFNAMTGELQEIGGAGEWVPLWEVEVTLIPTGVGGWVNLWEVEVTLVPEGYVVCTPGTTKCAGPNKANLYTCNAESRWELTQVNSPLCVVEEKPIPWEWLLIGGGVALAAGMLLAKKSPPEKRT